MYHNDIYKCGSCGEEIQVDSHYSAGTCACGGKLQHCGESYDQEFVDEERYNEQQDREYESRHRYDN
jgi:predicted RNA-binding Zn-ribbon protein involved in translation (DUF1610 family)